MVSGCGFVEARKKRRGLTGCVVARADRGQQLIRRGEHLGFLWRRHDGVFATPDAAVVDST
jgi:hypothetical protein